MATRNAPPESEEPTSGLTDADRSEIRQIVAETLGSLKGSDKAPEARQAAPKVTDDAYDRMTDRQRENHVRQLVDFHLEELARDDEIRAQRDEIERLKADKHPEPEAAPSVVTKLQKFLWGEPEP